MHAILFYWMHSGCKAMKEDDNSCNLINYRLILWEVTTAAGAKNCLTARNTRIVKTALIMVQPQKAARLMLRHRQRHPCCGFN